MIVLSEQTENKSDNRLQVNAALSDWEEMMLSELATKYNLKDDIVLDIGITFLMNELSASMNGKPSVLNSLHRAGFANDVTLPDESETTDTNNEKKKD